MAMSLIVKPALPVLKSATHSHHNRVNVFLARLDLVALLTAMLGLGLLGVAAAVFAVIETARLLATLWIYPVDRWLMVGFALAAIWVTVRRKKLRVF